METTICEVVHLTTQEFKGKVFNHEKGSEWKYGGSLSAIVDYYADWYQPCKMIEPVFEEFAFKYAGKIVVYEVDTVNEQELVSVFGIQSIPSVLSIPKEVQPQSAMGALPKYSFEKVINGIDLKN
jgi:thioredoxin 1